MNLRNNKLRGMAFGIATNTPEIILHYNNRLGYQGPVSTIPRTANGYFNHQDFYDLCTWQTEFTISGFVPVAITAQNCDLVVTTILMNKVRGSTPGQLVEQHSAQWVSKKPDNLQKFVHDRINLSDDEFYAIYSINKYQAEQNVKWIPEVLSDDVFIQPNSNQFGNDGKFNVRINGQPVIYNGDRYQEKILGNFHYLVLNGQTIEFDYMVSPLTVDQYNNGPPKRPITID